MQLGWLALVPAMLAGAATACPGLAVVRLSDDAVLARLAVTDGFTLEHLHSVTLRPVAARYALAPDGTLRQVEERFDAHGPGMAHDGAGWRREGDAFVLPLDRRIDRLVLRADPRWANRLIAGERTLDLTRWPRVPLELRPRPCPATEPAP